MKEEPAILGHEPQTTGKPVVKVRHLYKSFGDRKVLIDLSMDLAERENLAILGKSGTGKSVLIIWSGCSNQIQAP
jgi:ABC-type transporter Mla maintaining outer membrane lipid asymmetry ATPase subunit MlaF